MKKLLTLMTILAFVIVMANAYASETIVTHSHKHQGDDIFVSVAHSEKGYTMKLVRCDTSVQKYDYVYYVSHILENDAERVIKAAFSCRYAGQTHTYHCEDSQGRRWETMFNPCK